MTVVAFVVAFIALGLAVGFVAFFGGPSGARQAYLTRGSRAFKIAIPVIYIALGIAVPAIVLADGKASTGSGGGLGNQTPTPQVSRGKTLFRSTCWSCHTLKAAGAMGVTGPDLDDIGPVTQQRVLNAIKIGGTGDGRMPPGLLQGKDAQAVALYVSSVAGR
jgi:mono/diheme cytochrome c family protein